LSIQCHPDRAQARAGFVRENEAGIPVGAPERNYRDPNPKPELIVALSRFLALKGFRPVAQILAGLRPLASATLAPALARLEARADAQSVKALFGALMAHEGPARAALLDGAVAAARGRSEEAWGWVLRLRERYPSDVGVLAPLFLNLVELGPEEGLFLEAGELHAYLEGTGIELMASSDNVLRGGLTPKHVDVAELLHVARFEPRAAVVLRPAAAGAGERVFRTPAAEFELGVLDVAPGAPHHALPRGAELLLGLSGDAEVAAGGVRLPLARGRSVFIPAAAAYSIQGAGRVCRARVPAL
jgi:mannose-6-phosphate isomerase